MYLPNPITGAGGPQEFVFEPGTPIYRWETTGANGANLKPGRMSLLFRVAFDGFFAGNKDSAHQLNMLRATLSTTSPGNPDSGNYRGHGGIFGNLFNKTAQGMIESWGPGYGVPGGHYIPPGSQSPKMRDFTFYDVEITSLLSAGGYKFASLSITEPGQIPLHQTGDVLDDNPDVDMSSESLAMCCIFDGAGPVRIIKPQVVWTPDSVPRGDFRK